MASDSLRGQRGQCQIAYSPANVKAMRQLDVRDEVPGARLAPLVQHVGVVHHEVHVLHSVAE